MRTMVWSLLIASVLFVQIAVGLWLDGRYDPGVRRYGLWLPWYALAYWMLTAAAAVRGSIPGLRARPAGPVTWNIQRRADDTA